MRSRWVGVEGIGLVSLNSSIMSALETVFLFSHPLEVARKEFFISLKTVLKDVQHLVKVQLRSLSHSTGHASSLVTPS